VHRTLVTIGVQGQFHQSETQPKKRHINDHTQVEAGDVGFQPGNERRVNQYPPNQEVGQADDEIDDRENATFMCFGAPQRHAIGVKLRVGMW